MERVKDSKVMTTHFHLQFIAQEKKKKKKKKSYIY